MNTERARRKLRAILSTDVKGYSRLIREDEEATVNTLKKHRDVMSKLIGQYRDPVVDSPGDNLLAEFPSAVDAVECAVTIQEDLNEKNAELPENRRTRFRIGVILGNVIVDGDRIYGDGVNIAARIEGLAEGGGVCISRSVYDQVKNKLASEYEYLGAMPSKDMAWSAGKRKLAFMWQRFLRSIPGIHWTPLRELVSLRPLSTWSGSSMPCAELG